jgi:hypothetical protein
MSDIPNQSKESWEQVEPVIHLLKTPSPLRYTSASRFSVQKSVVNLQSHAIAGRKSRKTRDMEYTPLKGNQVVIRLQNHFFGSKPTAGKDVSLLVSSQDSRLSIVL